MEMWYGLRVLLDSASRVNGLHFKEAKPDEAEMSSVLNPSKVPLAYHWKQADVGLSGVCRAQALRPPDICSYLGETLDLHPVETYWFASHLIFYHKSVAKHCSCPNNDTSLTAELQGHLPIFQRPETTDR